MTARPRSASTPHGWARVGVMLILAGLFSAAWAQPPDNRVEPDAPFPLDTIPVPEPSNLAEFVRDKAAAEKLGKALFWDMQTGSDGIMACASCHFHAGADPRSKNQLSPNGAPPAIDPGSLFEIGGPNYQLLPEDFPFRRFSDPEDAETAVFDSDDVCSSQGVMRGTFNDIVEGDSLEDETRVPDDVFHVAGTTTRRVEPRNTPSVINAIFNIENFWDGRAKFFFNGQNPFGLLDDSASVLCVQPDGTVESVQVKIDRASAASQAVGPPLSDFEMSSGGKNFPKLAKKLFALTPLGKQLVAPDDSTLGPCSLWPAPGLNTTYQQLIMDAFEPKWWDSDILFDIDCNQIGNGVPANTDEFTLMEKNFALFWGLAIQCYEALLVSDETPFDAYQNGDPNALTEEQKIGLEIFLNQGACINCHEGPEFTGATIDNLLDNPLNGEEPEGIIERMNMADGEAIYDAGFYNIGVRPTAEDILRGGTAFGKPLSFSRFAKEFGEDELCLPSIDVDPNERDAVDGACKTPGLRNIELTGPYFHNGGTKTLFEVVQFYTRGGDFADENIDDLDPDIEPIGHLRGKPDRQRALAAFMLALTDERVRYARAPFDYPQLFVVNGHTGDDLACDDDGDGRGLSDLVEIPAVGAGGKTDPIETFLGCDPLGPSISQTVNDRIVLFATNSIWLRNRSEIIDGNVVVNDASPGPMLAGDDELMVALDVETSFFTHLIADSIRIREGSHVEGSVTFNELVNLGQIDGSQNTPLAVPQYGPTDLPEFKATAAGTDDVIVADGETLVLAPGAYGNAIIGSGATLELSGGEYSFLSIDGGTLSNLLFGTFTEVCVEGRVEFDGGSTIAPSLTSTEDACGFVLYVAGTDVGPTRKDPTAVSFGPQMIVNANVYAPNGTIRFKKAVEAIGAFIAANINVGPDTEIDLDSRFEFPIAP